MLRVGDRVFAQILDGGRRRLAPARVVHSDKKCFQLSLDDGATPPIPDGSILHMYFESDGAFVVRQVCVKETTRLEGRGDVLVARALSSPVSAENRQEQRLNIERCGLVVGIDAVICPLVDVSESGFSVIHRAPFSVGEVQDVEMPVGERMYSGRARVMSAAWIEPGAFRCGFSSLSHAGVEDLQAGLRELVRPGPRGGPRGIWAAA